MVVVVAVAVVDGMRPNDDAGAAAAGVAVVAPAFAVTAVQDSADAAAAAVAAVVALVVDLVEGSRVVTGSSRTEICLATSAFL